MAAATAATDDETLLLQFSSLLQQLAPGSEADRLSALGGEVLRRWHHSRAAPLPAAAAAAAAAPAPALPAPLAAAAAPPPQLSPEQAALLAHADDSVRRALALAAVAARAPPPPPGKAYTNVSLPPEAHARATVAELRTAAEYRVGRPCLAIAHAGRVLDDPLQLLADAGVPPRAHLTLYFTEAALAEERPPLVAMHASPVLGGVGVGGGGGGSPESTFFFPAQQAQAQQAYLQPHELPARATSPLRAAQLHHHQHLLHLHHHQLPEPPHSPHHAHHQRHPASAPLEPYPTLHQQLHQQRAAHAAALAAAAAGGAPYYAAAPAHFSPSPGALHLQLPPAYAAASHALPLVNAPPPRLLAAGSAALPQPAAPPQSPSGGKQASRLHTALAAVHARTSPPHTVVMGGVGGGGGAGAGSAGGMSPSEVSTPPSEAEDLEHPRGHHHGHHGHHGHHHHGHHHHGHHHHGHHHAAPPHQPTPPSPEQPQQPGAGSHSHRSPRSPRSNDTPPDDGGPP